MNSATLHVHDARQGARRPARVSPANVQPGKSVELSTANHSMKKPDEFAQPSLDAAPGSVSLSFFHIFSIYISATFSSCYEKLIFLLTLLQKDMSLCAPIQDNQVILVHMPPHISPPAP